MIDRPVPHRPIPPLRPFLLPDLEVTPELARVLADLARAAQAGDGQARNALWDALAPAIDRLIGSARRRAQYSADTGPWRDGSPWDAEDLAQEAFPIFADLLAAWTSDRPVAPYLLGHFPWRLRSAWRVITALRRAEIVSASPRLRYLADGSAGAAEAMALLASIAADLSPTDGEILLRHVRDGEPLARVARDLALDRRTVTRRWRAIKETLRTDRTPTPTEDEPYRAPGDPSTPAVPAGPHAPSTIPPPGDGLDHPGRRT